MKPESLGTTTVERLAKQVRMPLPGYQLDIDNMWSELTPLLGEEADDPASALATLSAARHMLRMAVGRAPTNRESSIMMLAALGLVQRSILTLEAATDRSAFDFEANQPVAH